MATKQVLPTEVRPLHEIALEIRRDYHQKGKQVYYAALPYVNAMRQLSVIDDVYGEESGDMIVRYALSNLSTWRGDVAKRVKLELKAHLAGVKPLYPGGI